jgi:hypothetical protein
LRSETGVILGAVVLMAAVEPICCAVSVPSRFFIVVLAYLADLHD